METHVLTEEQRHQWGEDGLIVLRGALSPAEVVAFTAAVDAMYATHLQQPEAKPEMDRRARLAEFMKKGLGFAPGELSAAVDPAYDVLAMRVAEPAGEYGKRRSRR